MPALIALIIILLVSCCGCTTTPRLTDEQIADCFRRVAVLRAHNEIDAANQLQRDTLRIVAKLNK